MVEKAWDRVADAKTRIENLSPAEVAAEIAAGTAVVVDIRDIRELIREGRIGGSVHAPRGMLEFWIDPDSGYHRSVFDPAKRYILYCAGGGRSALAADVMREMGYPNVAHLEPGMDGWKADGRAFEDVEPPEKWRS